MDEGIALLVPQADGLGIGVVIHTGDQHHLRAIAAGGLNLGQGRTLRNTDHRVDAHVAGGKRHALRMVSGGAGNNAPRLFLVRQRGDLVIRAAQLERAGLLQAVGLQEQAALVGDAGAGDHRGLVDDAGQYALGVVQHCHSQHSSSSFTIVRGTYTLLSFLYFYSSTACLRLQSLFRKFDKSGSFVYNIYLVKYSVMEPDVPLVNIRRAA